MKYTKNKARSPVFSFELMSTCHGIRECRGLSAISARPGGKMKGIVKGDQENRRTRFLDPP